MINHLFKILITSIILLGISACGGGGGGGDSSPTTVSLRGVAATGQAAPEGSEVCLQAWNSKDDSLGTFETKLDCTLTDAMGGFMFENLQDKIDFVKDKLLVLKVVIDDPISGIKELFSINHQTGTDNRTANINEVTDLQARIAFNEATFGRIIDPEDCWLDSSCMDDLHTEFTSAPSFLDDVVDGVTSFLGSLLPEGRDPVTDSYVADPQLDELDALQERVDFTYDPYDGEVWVSNQDGIVIAVAPLDQLQQVDIGESVDAISDAEALEAINLAGGFSTAGDDGTARLTCWKEFRDVNGTLALTEGSCATSVSSCEEAGGVAAESPHETAASCATACQRNAASPFDIYLAGADADGSNALYAQSTCISDISLFNNAVTLEPLTQDEACAAGLQEACIFRAAIVATPSSGEAPLIVTLDGSGSEGEIIGWSWSSDDGQTATGVTAEFTFAAEGEYLITLTVTDTNGNSVSSEQPIHVGQLEPTEFITASFGGQQLDFGNPGISGSTGMDDSNADTVILFITVYLYNESGTYTTTKLSLIVPAVTTGTFSGTCNGLFEAELEENILQTDYTQWVTVNDGSSSCEVTYTTETIIPNTDPFSDSYSTHNRRTRADYSFQVMYWDYEQFGGYSSPQTLSGSFAFTWQQF